MILLVLALDGGLSACGSTPGPARGSHSTGPTATSAAAGSAPTRPQALAFAGAVNLTAADLPGFTSSSGRESKTPQEARAERQMLRCTGSLGSGNGLAEVSSKNFELKRDILELGVSSEVSVLQTAALADTQVKAIRSDRVRECFTRYLAQLLGDRRFGGATLSPVSIQSGTPPAPGTGGSFGWRVTAALEVHRVRLPFYMDILGFVYGPARVTLFSSGALRPFPAAIQQQLFSLLLARAKAHRL